MAPDDADSLERKVVAIVESHRAERGPLLPVLHEVQRELGWIDPRAVPMVANALNLSRAEVHGVVSFYRDFRSAPPAMVQVRLCRAEACQANGCERTVEHARRRLGIDVGQTAADGSVSLGEVFCLGNCALGPSAMIDGRLHGRVDAARFDALVDGTRHGGT